MLTKADKLSRSAQQVRVRELAAAIGLPEDQIQATSVKAGLGIAELRDSIAAAADQASGATS